MRTVTFRAAAAASLAAMVLTGLPATAQADVTITCTPSAPAAIGIVGGPLTQEASTGYHAFGETLAKASKAGAPDSWRVDIAAGVTDHPTLGCQSDDPLDTSFSVTAALAMQSAPVSPATAAAVSPAITDMTANSKALPNGTVLAPPAPIEVVAAGATQSILLSTTIGGKYYIDYVVKGSNSGATQTVHMLVREVTAPICYRMRIFAPENTAGQDPAAYTNNADLNYNSDARSGCRSFGVRDMVYTVGNVTHGALTAGSGNGKYTFTPEADFVPAWDADDPATTSSFTFRAVDAYGMSSLDVNNEAKDALATLTISEPGCEANLASGTSFNNPTGSDANQFRITNRMIQYIDCAAAVAKAKPGSDVVITMSWFSLTDGQIISHLKTAKANGADVRFLINSHTTKSSSSSYSYWKQIYKAFNGADWNSSWTPATIPALGPAMDTRWASANGADKAGGSWAMFCDKGCLTPPCITAAGINACKDFPADSEGEYPAMHSKFFAIMFPPASDGGASTQTTVVGVASSNPTVEQAVRGWNNMQVVVERGATASANPVFSSIDTYFHDMAGQALPAPIAGGAPSATYSPPYLGRDGGLGTSGATTFTAFPRAGSGGSTDNITQILNKVKCRYKDSKGKMQRTQIYVNMFVFTRNSPAMKLWRLAFNPLRDKTTPGGCQIHILYTDMDSAIRSVAPGSYGKWLTTKGKKAGKKNIAYGAADCLSAPGTRNGHWRSMVGLKRIWLLDANGYPVKNAKGKARTVKEFVCNRGTLQGRMPTINTYNKGLCWLNHGSSVSGGSINACVSTPLKLTPLDPADLRAKLEYYPDGSGRYSYSHQKYMLISGMYNGSVQKVTVAGTPNFSNPGLRWNDEIMSITAGNSATSKATYAAYLANYKAMRSYIGGRRLPAFNICRQNGTCK